VKKLFIDIGGTNLRSELCEGDQIVRHTLPSSQIGLLEYIDREMRSHRDIDFIGIAYAGQVRGGKILSAPNIDIDEYDIVSVIEKRYGIRSSIDNDLNCALRAEAAYWGEDTIAALYVGTGIGAAVMDHGAIMRGGGNVAFEIGHIPYETSPLRCGCGRSNCIELFASGSGIGKWCEHYHITTPPYLKPLKNSSDEREQAVAKGFEKGLLHAAGVLVTLANPNILVLGGGVVQENRYLATLLRKELCDYALAASLSDLRIEISVLENGPLEGTKLLEQG
jgi:glucokinase